MWSLCVRASPRPREVQLDCRSLGVGRKGGGVPRGQPVNRDDLRRSLQVMGGSEFLTSPWFGRRRDGLALEGWFDLSAGLTAKACLTEVLH